MISNIQLKDIIEYIKNLGDLSIFLREKGLEINIKEDDSKVTNVDIEINEKIYKYFSTNYPKYGIISEEFDKKYKDTNWFVDPINGTGAYINKRYGYFNILVALLKRIIQY